MAKKLGDVLIGLIFLSFIIAGISGFIIQADLHSGNSNKYLSNTLSDLNKNLSGVDGLIVEFTDKTDSTGSFSIDDSNQEVDKRGSDSGGVMNIFSKNILVSFFTTASNEIPGTAKIFAFLISIFAVIISVMILRFFLGENKI